jgi:hypothetical protein
MGDKKSMGVLMRYGTSDKFSGDDYAPKEKWDYHFGSDVKFVRDFLALRPQYMIERYLPIDKFVPHKFRLWDVAPTEKELVGEFDSPAEMVAILKLIP